MLAVAGWHTALHTAYHGMPSMSCETLPAPVVQGLAPTIELTAQDAIPQHMSEVLDQAKDVIRKARFELRGYLVLKLLHGARMLTYIWSILGINVGK